jgi:GH15 family glucan-1,4-alpha-glucosidase
MNQIHFEKVQHTYMAYFKENGQIYTGIGYSRPESLYDLLKSQADFFENCDFYVKLNENNINVHNVDRDRWENEGGLHI